MPRPSVRTALATALVLALAPFALIACGGGGSKTTSTSTGTTSATGTTSTGAGATTSTAPTTASGNAIVELFFNTVRSETIRRGLSPKLADCVVTELRRSITSQDLADLVKNGGKPTASMSQKATIAGRTCALQSTGK